MNVEDGGQITSAMALEADVVVVGSGPAGAAVARTLARAGLGVVVVEEGPWAREVHADGLRSLAALYRDMGATVALGSPPMPVLQGRLVGGTSVVNGAICWRLPRDVWDEWVADDPALADALPWAEIEAVTTDIERDLHIAPTDPAIAGPHNLLLARGAAALGLEHRPIRRNVHGCRGLGQCLQGCPEGNKLSMDRSYLVDAAHDGARILSGTRVERVVVERGRARGIQARTTGGARVTVRAGTAVVLACSAVQTPLLLRASGLDEGPVGDGFQAHPGISVAGVFREEVRMWTGATQGHEVIGLRREGIKFEALGYDVALVAMRAKGYGGALGEELAELADVAHWGAAVRARARGRVRRGLLGTSIRYTLDPEDLRRVQRGVRVLGELFLAAGAQVVYPGVHGWHERITDRASMARFEEEAPRDPNAYTLAATHLFGTCRMGSERPRSVVRPDFRHHGVAHLYVADSSVFPTNIGVNPQLPILALATLCGRRILTAHRAL